MNGNVLKFVQKCNGKNFEWSPYTTCGGMSIEDQLLSYISSSNCCLCESKELNTWYESILRKGDKEKPLHAILDELVKQERLKLKKVGAEENETCDIYWLPFDYELSPELNKSPVLLRQSQSIKRQFVSPLLNSTKRPKIIVDGVAQKLDFSQDSQTSTSASNKDCHTQDNLEELVRERKELLSELSEKEDQLHKLQLVKLYRSKNNLDELEGLIQKWREVSQEAAEELLSKSHADPKPTMSNLLDYLNIDSDVIHYSKEDENFY